MFTNLSHNIWLLIIIFTAISLVVGLLLGIATSTLKAKSSPLEDSIDAMLPQTQCGQCGYPGCKPYAKALIEGEAINKCVPGGQVLVEKLAELLDREIPSDTMEEPEEMVAVINEDMCIGCTKCIQACPVDAIIGANKVMHSIVPDLCTGCTLCVAPCPTDCIEMIKVKPKPTQWDWKTKLNLEQLIDINTNVAPNKAQVKHD